MFNFMEHRVRNIKMVWCIDLKILMMGWSNTPPLPHTHTHTEINVVLNILCSQIFISNIQVKFNKCHDFQFNRKSLIF